MPSSASPRTQPATRFPSLRAQLGPKKEAPDKKPNVEDDRPVFKSPLSLSGRSSTKDKLQSSPAADTPEGLAEFWSLAEDDEGTENTIPYERNIRPRLDNLWNSRMLTPKYF